MFGDSVQCILYRHSLHGVVFVWKLFDIGVYKLVRLIDQWTSNETQGAHSRGLLDALSNRNLKMPQVLILSSVFSLKGITDKFI